MIRVSKNKISSAVDALSDALASKKSSRREEKNLSFIHSTTAEAFARNMVTSTPLGSVPLAAVKHSIDVETFTSAIIATWVDRPNNQIVVESTAL